MEIRGNNEQDHLILRKDYDTNTFNDITKQIIYINDFNRNYYVIFIDKNKNKKQTCVSYNNLYIYQNPINIDFDKNKVYIDKKLVYNVNCIKKFENIGYKVFFNNQDSRFIRNISINNGEVHIVNLQFNNSQSGNRVFDYYMNLSKYASDISEGDLNSNKLLYRLYCNNKKVRDESVLDIYTKSNIKKELDDKFIYPFTTNESQMKALNNAFNYNLSVISGPPGTGKTQVILNIITNALIKNKTIAVISNNNTAVENIYIKMEEQRLDFLLANLGNSDNVENFFNNQKDYNLEVVESHEPYSKIKLTEKEFAKLFKYKNELTILKQDRFELEEEYRHFKESNKINCIDFNINYKDYNKYLALKFYLMSKKNINIFNKLKIKFYYKVKKFDIDKKEYIIDYLDNQYYINKIKYIDSIINEKDNYLKRNNIDEISNKLMKDSRGLLKNYVYLKYRSMEKYIFTKENYINNFEKFINRYPITLSTTHSLLRNCPNNFMYDMIIIDEASQSDILTALLTMNICKKMVIVGDIKQLSQIDNEDIYDASEELLKYYNIPQCYQYKDNSILNSVMSLKTKVPNTVLREHYRCDSRIIEFCNKKFYNNELIICTKTAKEDPLIIVHTVQGNHARKNPNDSGQYNDREAQEIINIIKNNEEKDIGIITPFRAQANYISSLINNKYPYVEVDTIHKYQGRQKKIVILSTVVNNLAYDKKDFITDFITQSQLLNVAISRAISKLYLVVSDGVYNSKFNNIATLIDYIKYYCTDSISTGKVVSVFDNLYKENYKTLLNSPLMKYVDSEAESIIIKLINEILIDYPEYRFSMHVRLSSLINNYNNFNDYEIKYINNRLTHVDFVIYNNITYKPVLCIEVDGTKYHDYSKVQINHDNIKNRILISNGINILRLKTNNSGEEKKIRIELDKTL